MNCREWEERIALLAGGDLPEAERAVLERHLGGCPPCREFARAMAESVAWMQEADEEIAPAHYAAVRARVLDRLRTTSRPSLAWRWLTAAACAALVLLAMLWVKWPASNRTPAPRAVARDAGPPLALTPAEAPPPAVRPATRPVRHARPPHPREPVLVKIETDNPDVVIYWIAN